MTETEKHQQQEVIAFWHKSALRDRDTARSLLSLKHNDWSLFIFHLALEKILKATIVKDEKTPPPIHDLERLAELAGLELVEEKHDWLNEITGFNIAARYPNEKKSLYETATPEYTAQWHDKCETLFTTFEAWLTN